jgi:hypothetical protein
MWANLNVIELNIGNIDWICKTFLILFIFQILGLFVKGQYSTE